MKIVIETETPGDPRATFRVTAGAKVIGERLIAVQAHILVGEILERLVLPPKPKSKA